MYWRHLYNYVTNSLHYQRDSVYWYCKKIFDGIFFTFWLNGGSCNLAYKTIKKHLRFFFTFDNIWRELQHFKRNTFAGKMVQPSIILIISNFYRELHLVNWWLAMFHISQNFMKEFRYNHQYKMLPHSNLNQWRHWWSKIKKVSDTNENDLSLTRKPLHKL